MIRRLIKLAVSLLLCAWDTVRHTLLRALGRRPAGHAVILYYHGIRPEETDRFARQMQTLQRTARPIPADWKGPLAPGTCHAAVTFDDGFCSVLDHALPVLRDARIPATVFVPSGLLGQRPAWLTNPRSRAANEMVMTPAQLQDLAKSPGITVGSHTVRHRRLDTLPEAEARQELFDSKKNLEDILGQPVPLFSFPHGAFTDRVLSLARDAGYQTVYTISPTCAREQMNGFVAGRVKVDPDDWMIEFRLKLRGAYRWMARG